MYTCSCVHTRLQLRIIFTAIFTTSGATSSSLSVLIAERGGAGNRNQKVFEAANYVTKSDWDTALL